MAFESLQPQLLNAANPMGTVEHGCISQSMRRGRRRAARRARATVSRSPIRSCGRSDEVLRAAAAQVGERPGQLGHVVVPAPVEPGELVLGLAVGEALGQRAGPSAAGARRSARVGERGVAARLVPDARAARAGGAVGDERGGGDPAGRRPAPGGDTATPTPGASSPRGTARRGLVHRSKRGSRSRHKRMHGRARGRCRGGRGAGGRRGSPRGQARGAIRRASGNGSSSSCAARGSRWSRRGARARRASRRAAGADGSSRAPAGGSGRPCGQRGAAAEHEALGERVRRQPVGAVEAGARALADRVQPGQRRAPVEVGGHAAHRVVRGGRDRDQVARGVDARPPRARRRCSGSARGRPSACRVSTAGSPLRVELVPGSASATSSRGASSSTKRSPSRVEQRARPRRAPPR